VKILRGAWNVELFRILEGFPDLAHDDEVDASSGSLEMLNRQMKNWASTNPIGNKPNTSVSKKEGS
jgi:phage terminase large subunit-like protein